MRTCALVCLVVAASAADALSASPETLPVAETSLVESVAAVSCRSNTYYWGSYQGKHYCVKCPAKTISNGCQNCNKDPKHKACYTPLDCPKGKFVDKGGIICTSCPSGKWQSKVGQAKCWNCPSGLYQPKAGLHSCYKCPVGRFSSTEGSKKCSKCDTCKKGTFGTTKKTGSKAASDCSCKKCEAGKFAPEKYTTCFACPAGRYQNEAGAFSCYYCPTGKFQSGTTATTCDKCPIGTTTPKKGTSKGSDCKKSGLICKVGSYRKKQDDGSAQCSVCPAGMYGKLVSASYGGHCYKCDNGKFQDKTGKTACKQCEDGQVASADGKKCGALPTYEVHFRLYNYQLASALIGRGWKLLNLQQAVAMKDLIFGSYKQEKGFELLGSWKTTSCCLTLAQGYRLTANGVSFVYPMDSTASSLKCSSSMNYYTSAHKMRLAFHNGNNMAELTGAKKIGGAVGSGLCAKRAGENNPGVYMARTKTTKMYPKNRCKTIGSERLCLAPEPTPAPTQAPTLSPTQVPTQRPTMEPTPFNTPALPKHCKKVKCQQDTPKGCNRRFVHQYNKAGCPLYPCGKLDCTKKTKVDCQVSDWGSWSTCSKTCGSGHNKAERTVTQIPLNGGAECPILMKIKPCRLKHCPINCQLSKWSKWSGCSVTCGTGVHRRHRNVVKENQHGGSCNVKDLLDEKPCKAAGTCAPTNAPTNAPTINPTMQPTSHPTRMPINCEWEYGSWTKCTRQCGGGSRSRNLIIITESARGGTVCPAEKKQAQLCNTMKCPEHCKVSDWNEWTKCSTTCGFGTKARTRAVTAEPKNGGIGCPELHQKRACEWVDCPVHCSVSKWGAWGRCSMECGEGVRQRTRKVLIASEFGGSECPSLIDDKKCNRGACPINCKVGKWSKFSACDKTCGVGTHTRTRKVLVKAKNSGVDCPPTKETELCHVDSCPIHCVTDEWAAWSTCTKSCGIGENKRSRSRNVVQQAQHGGKACDDIYQEEDCEVHACPVHCEVYKWQKFQTCTKTCGGGTHSRIRAIKTHDSHGGKPCPHLKDTKVCNEHKCPNDCQVSAWGDWDKCTKSCNGGKKTRTRKILQKSNTGGSKCPSLTVTRDCNSHACPIDCGMSKWAKWSKCDKSCSTLKIYGTQSRTRKALKKESYGGKECSKTYEERPCNSFACPVDCQVGSFNDWTECSVSCGTGYIYRTRPILREAADGGMKCPSLLQSNKCTMKPCTVKCQVGKWSKWSPCAKSCGTGYQTRKRSKQAQKGKHQMNCPTLEQTKVCGTGVCPIDCKMTVWEEWSHCSHTCGGGEKKRRRSVDHPAAFGGKACGMLQETAKCYTEKCPVDCTVGKWSNWPSCSSSCGSGWTTRKRSIKNYPTFGGAMCPRLDESRQCNEGVCPVHCDVSKWNAWSVCSKTCGGGLMRRTRKVVTKATHGGYKCPNLKVEIKCNTRACPNDCEVSEWSKWGACDKTCGQGYRQKLRTVVTKATRRGKPCPSLTKTEACNTHKCAIDCKYTKWTPFGVCSKSCSSGHQSHHRSVIREAAFGGLACGELKITKSCNMHACPINCVVSEWNKWTQCTKKCGGGYRTRSRKVVQEPTFGGWKCPKTEQKHSCNASPCALNCEVSDWGFWSECSKSCGIGASTRVRQIIQHAHKGEWICPHLSQTKSCNQHQCPVDCKVSLFTKWGACNASCGGGTKTRKRAILAKATLGGAPCPSRSETKECANQKCPADCKVSKFTKWTKCDKTCGTGSQVRSRSIVSEAARGGNKCPVLNEARQCATDVCPVDCEVTEFKSWTPCSRTCGWGQETRTRLVKVKASGGGKPCPDIKETRACQEQECPVSCKVTAWSVWTDCDRSCGAGKQMHNRRIVKKGRGGKKCPATAETRECNSHECPKDCKLSEFLPWSACTKTCGGGTQTQYRVVISPALYGGNKCGVLTQTQKCGARKCPIDCKLSAWKEWSECTKTCGHGTQRRVRKMITKHGFGGKKCGDTFMSRGCDAGPCPTHCEVGKWGKFSACTKSCGNGKKTRTRTVSSHAKNGGYVCPALSQSADCNTMACAVDCTVTGWSAFDLCDAECGKGRKHRTRVIVQPMVGGGKACAPIKDSAACDAGPCAVKCIVSQWGKWRKCDKTCGGGRQIRSRNIKRKSKGGMCPWLKQTRECNVDPCPIDCVVKKWSNWGGCSKSCGTGKQIRTRKAFKASKFEGLPCPALKQIRACETHHCPVDCGVTAFGSWSKCTKTCGSGNKRRQRHITGQTEMYGGKKCPHLLEHSTCNNAACPIDCKMSRWGPLSDCSVTCGVGTQTRAREIDSIEKNGGLSCGSKYQTIQCNDGHCPDHCQVTKFGPWSSCSKTCGMGKRTRRRTIVKHGGAGFKCPNLKEQSACSTMPCKVDCEVSKFNKWTTCSRSCNTGFQSRSRAVITKPQYHGKPCPSLRMARTCNDHKCPVNCIMQPWAAWSQCSVTCKTGVQKRSRKMKRRETFGGKECTLTRGLFFDQHRECDAGPCPVRCTVTSWGDYSTCSEKCGTGFMTRKRTVTHKGRKSVCPLLEQTKECNTEKCAQDCVYSQFGKWSPCTRTCGGGMRYRERHIVKKPNFLGKQCPTLHQRQQCGKAACPVDCEMGPISKWTVCSKTCGVGSRYATRKVIRQPVFGGKACPPVNLSERCNAVHCPVDCDASRWSSWSTCVKSSVDKCARAKFRKIVREPMFGGKACPAVSDKWEKCPQKKCAGLNKDSCSHVKCIYYKEAPFGGAAPQGHIRVYHHNNEQRGNKHVCRHIGATCQCTCHSETE